jgi:predicted transcriptional regulator
MATLNMRLDDDLDRRLSQEAERASQTRSELARRAIEAFLSQRQRQRFLDEIARAARARDLVEKPLALATDNEALAIGEGRVTERPARYRARRKKR